MRKLYTKFENKIYELFNGHPRLLDEEAKIVCDVRDDYRFKHLDENQIRALIRIKISQMYGKYKKQQKCQHEKWDCDTVIRTIECQECGKRAWLEDYRSLYK